LQSSRLVSHWANNNVQQSRWWIRIGLLFYLPNCGDWDSFDCYIQVYYGGGSAINFKDRGYGESCEDILYKKTSVVNHGQNSVSNLHHGSKIFFLVKKIFEEFAVKFFFSQSNFIYSNSGQKIQLILISRFFWDWEKFWGEILELSERYAVK
jgi:hypothetical protein